MGGKRTDVNQMKLKEADGRGLERALHYRALHLLKGGARSQFASCSVFAPLSLRNRTKSMHYSSLLLSIVLIKSVQVAWLGPTRDPQLP